MKLRRTGRIVTMIAAVVLATPPVRAGVLENPNNGLFYSGIGVISGWKYTDIGDGPYTTVAYEKRVEFNWSTFSVATTGEKFLRGVTATVQAPNFPAPGETAILVWNQSTQHFELTAVVGPDPYYMNMQIIVEPGGWGVARPSDITSLLEDVASHLDRLLRTPFTEVIRVRQAPDQIPRTLLCIPVRTRILSCSDKLRRNQRKPKQMVSRDDLRACLRVHS